jgi:hypothetical protein
MESLDSTALVGPIRKEIDLNYVDMSSSKFRFSLLLDN